MPYLLRENNENITFYISCWSANCDVIVIDCHAYTKNRILFYFVLTFKYFCLFDVLEEKIDIMSALIVLNI